MLTKVNTTQSKFLCDVVCSAKFLLCLNTYFTCLFILSIILSTSQDFNNVYDAFLALENYP